MGKSLNLQDMFLNQARKEGVPVTIYLMGGVQLKGHVKGFDAFTVIIEAPGKPTQLIYKHGILSIVPAATLQSFREAESPEPGPE